MNRKKLVITVIVVFVLLELTNFLIHNVLLLDTYMMEEHKTTFRTPEEFGSLMWISFLMDLVWSFFFVFFFVKGYEDKGIMEGVRFGIYIGLFYSMIMAYKSYVFAPIVYSLAFQWFIYGLIQCVILGIVTALVYKPKTEPAA